MARVKRSVNALKKRRKVMRLAKGYFGAKSKQYRAASEQVRRSLRYAYIGRKQKKRDFRRLWIARINAAARINGLSYSRMINGLKVAGVDINRKVLSELAISDPAAFTALAEKAKVAVRSIRRDSNEKLKAMKKAGDITEDDLSEGEKKIQKLTDKYCKQVDEVAKAKEKEIMEI